MLALRSRPARLLFRPPVVRTLASRAGSEDKNKYAATLRLPRTKFPQRANAAVREPELQKACLHGLYREQLARDGAASFLFHDGPPYANGPPHIGHFLNKVLKDVVNRYKVQRGFRVEYVPGWDCHGLPIELKALEKVKKSKREGMDAMAIRRVARQCALDAIDVQRTAFERWGVMADWSTIYRTLDPEYEAHQIDVFRHMVERGLVYRGLRPVYWSPSSKTALADAELEYEDDHCSKSIYVAFPLAGAHEATAQLDVDNDALLAWTTTPWSLPANEAICVNRALEYVAVRVPGHAGKRWIVARELVDDVGALLGFSHDDVVASWPGSALVGAQYRHPLLGIDAPSRQIGRASCRERV